MEDVDGMLINILEARLSPEGYSWLHTKGIALRDEEKAAPINRIFAQVPRFASKVLVGGAEAPVQRVKEIMPGYDMRDWTLETLCRVWLLLQVPSGKKADYVSVIDSLFIGAEVNELLALYKAFPLLHYPEQWIRRCEEGIRSNIGSVLEAIMYHNPYPAEYLSEAAWNQMILKAFFTEKDVAQIYGLKRRINPALEATLADYVQERLAAGRSVNPEIYKLMEV
jgi:hypothetical protein